MVQGLDRREVVQDPLQNIQPTADALPVPGIQTPGTPGGLNRVGEDQLVMASLFDKAGGMVNSYFERKTKEWEAEGKMAFAAGKTEAELAKSGNRYTMAGFMASKAATASNVWQTSMIQKLNDSDHQLDPAAYQAELKKSYSELAQQVAGADPYTQEIFAAQMDEILPDLASKQMLANNEWRKSETINSLKSYRASVIGGSKSLPEKLQIMKEQLSPGATALSKEDEQKLNVDTILFAASQKDTIAAKALINANASRDTLMNAPLQALSSIVGQAESGNNYNVANGKRPVNFTGMTIKEVLAWQREDQKTNGKMSSAAGRYQFMPDTLEEEMKAAGLTEDTLFNEATQDKLFKSRLVTRGLDKFAKGEISAEQFQLNLAQEWAGLPMDMNGKGYHDSETNQASVEPGVLLRALEADTSGASTVESMAAQGYQFDDIQRVQDALAKLADAKTQEFDTNRIQAEQALLQTAENSGDLPAVLKQIETMQASEGLSDNWAKSMASQAINKVEAYNKNYAKQTEVRGLLSGNSLGTADAAQQKAGMELVRKEAIAYLNTQEHLDPQVKITALQDKVRKVAIDNNVVDSVTAAQIENTLSGELLNKDGTVKSAAIQAYDEVRKLVQQGGIAYASKYFGNASELITTALAYDTGNSDTATSLTLAQDIQRKRAAGEFKEPSINPVAVADGVNEFLNATDPSWFAHFTSKRAVPSGLLSDNLYDEEHARLRNNEQLSSTLKTLAIRNILKNPGQPEKAAITAAAAELAQKAEPAFGHILMSGSASTIREDMGLKGDNTVNLVEGALGDYIRTHGENLWGSRYNPRRTLGQKLYEPVYDVLNGASPLPNIFPEAAAAKQTDRNLPEFSRITYDPQNKTITVDLWADVNKTEALGQARTIAVSAIGAEWKNPKNVAERKSRDLRRAGEWITEHTLNTVAQDSIPRKIAMGILKFQQQR